MTVHGTWWPCSLKIWVMPSLRPMIPMSIGIIGRKLGMTQIFNEQGHQVPCTVIEAEPNPVVAVTTSENGVPGVQLGLGKLKVARDDKSRKPRGYRAAKSAIGHARRRDSRRRPRHCVASASLR